MSAFTIALLAGFAGSFHCIGMCGGFACGLNHNHDGGLPSLVIRNLLYNIGRLTTYAFIGALAGALGSALIGGPDAGAHAHHMMHESMSDNVMGMVLAGDLGIAQRALSAVAGLLMLLMAFELLGLRRHMPRSWAAIGAETFAGVLRTLLRSKSPTAPLALGVANGFLPCPLVFAFAAMAAATAAVEPAVLTMVAFGLGTFPAMLFMGAMGRVMSPRFRHWGVRAAGTFVLLIGVVTVVRGLAPGLLHVGNMMPMT